MNFTSRLTVLLCLALLAGCATVNVSLPAVTETPSGDRVPGKVVWHDLITHTPSASQRFYEELFGWTFEPLGIDLGIFRTANYTLIRHQGRLIGGMVDARDLGQRNPAELSQWVVVMSVADIAAAVVSVVEQGGVLRQGPVDLAERGWLAVVEDVRGARLALLETRDGDPADSGLPVGGFLWDEVWTDDLDATADFYADVAGLRSVDATLARGGSYRVLQSQTVPRAGVLPTPMPGLRPTWVSYIRVEDADEITRRVPGLGGSVLVGVTPRGVGGEAALIADPSGAGIAVQTWTAGALGQESAPRDERAATGD